MRITYTGLQTLAQNYCLQDTSAETLTFLKNELNLAIGFVFAELQNFTINRYADTTAVSGQQYYHLPVDNISIEACKYVIDDVIYTLESVDSQRRWDGYNSITFSGIAIPKYFFERKRDFGIWPIPQSTDTITLAYNAYPKQLINDDYTTGTATVTNGSQTLTGSAGGFTSSMVDSWFRLNSDGVWYKISAYISPTTLTLETAFAGSTSTGAFTLGETPEIPEDGHELLAYRAAEMYFSGPRKDKEQSIFWGNMFWTGDPHNSSRNAVNCHGGLLGLRSRYSKRSESAIIHRKGAIDYDAYDKVWGTHISP